jgi:hypothetical protein
MSKGAEKAAVHAPDTFMKELNCHQNEKNYGGRNSHNDVPA